jgi:hypothetical protein
MLSRFVLGFALGAAEIGALPTAPGCGEFDWTGRDSKCGGDASVFWVEKVAGETSDKR